MRENKGEPSFRDRPIWENDSLICKTMTCEKNQPWTISFACCFFFGGLVVLMAYMAPWDTNSCLLAFKVVRDICKTSWQNETVDPVDT